MDATDYLISFLSGTLIVTFTFSEATHVFVLGMIGGIGGLLARYLIKRIAKAWKAFKGFRDGFDNEG